MTDTPRSATPEPPCRHCGSAEHIKRNAMARAVPQSEPLDVERLAEALASSSEKWGWSTHDFAWDQLAEFIAAEYARLRDEEPSE